MFKFLPYKKLKWSRILVIWYTVRPIKLKEEIWAIIYVLYVVFTSSSFTLQNSLKNHKSNLILVFQLYSFLGLTVLHDIIFQSERTVILTEKLDEQLLIIKSKFIKCDLVKIREFIPICEMIKYLILRVCVSGDNINIEEKHYKGGVEDL